MLCRRFPSLLVPLLVACTLSLLATPLPADPPRAVSPTELMADRGDLHGADFSDDHLAGLTLTDAAATASRWDRADLRGAILRGLDLTGASLQAADLRGATLERLNLTSAVLREADLAGARLRDLNLIGADLGGVDLRGAEVGPLRLNPAGDRYLPALTEALTRLLGESGGRGEVTEAWAAGLCTLAFSFVFDAADWTRWPGAPSHYPPLTTALEAAGAQVMLRHKLGRGEAFFHLNRTLRDGGVCLLPLDMSHPGQTGSGLRAPVWATPLGFEGQGEAAVCVLYAPPFGEPHLLPEELNQRWSVRAPTLLPFGQRPAEASHLLITALPGKLQLTRQQMGMTALRQAVTVLGEPGPLPELATGVAGWEALLTTARAAAAEWDLARLDSLGRWGEGPRRDLIGARRLAADFLAELAELLPVQYAALLNQAATAYRTEAYVLDSQWVDLTGLDLTMRETVTPSVQQNLEVLAEALAAEQEALALLRRVTEADL